MFRTSKTHTNSDDVKVLTVGLFLTVVIFIGSMALNRASEYRWFRDLTALTPFHGVFLHDSKVLNSQIVLSGILIKRRCEFKALIGYVFDIDGVKYRVAVDTKPEDIDGVIPNRPPSTHSEKWGPWILDSGNVQAVSFEIRAEHINCPTPPKTQRNVFISGRWGNFTTK